MIRNPRADIIVKGGGSGDGIAAMLHGMVDIGATSRELSRAERSYAESKKLDLSIVELARDGIAIIAHRNNAIFALDFGQLRSVYSGKVRNWRDLGGKEDLELVAFARADGSGTASLFGERVLGEERYAETVQRLPSNDAIVAEVAARPGAIGYADLGAVRAAGSRIKSFAVRGDAQPAPVSPTAEAVQAAHYPLTRTLYLGIAGKPSGTAKALVDFCSSANGRTLIEKAGYFGIARPDP
jgi:phosphate transport system substrate-binding protein